MSAPDLLLATSHDWPTGEPGAERLDAALSERGVSARWARWDDPTVDWAGAALVAVRSTWDYVERREEFLAWVREVERSTPVLNGADVFAWNVDKAYLTRLAGVPVVPTRLVDSVADVESALAGLAAVVVKPRVGAGGFGVRVVGRGADLAALDLPTVPAIAQPLVETVHTDGEVSVFVLGGRAVTMVRKLPPAAGTPRTEHDPAPDDGPEIRVHAHFGGATTVVPLAGEPAEVAAAAVRAAGAFCDRPLDYARVDLLRLDGRWQVGEVEVTEPALYLDVLPANAEAFAALVRSRLDTPEGP